MYIPPLMTSLYLEPLEHAWRRLFSFVARACVALHLRFSRVRSWEVLLPPVLP